MAWANGLTAGARADGLSFKAARRRAALLLRGQFTAAELRAASPELKRIGTQAYGVVLRALRQSA